jgi:hypothetical protein
MIIGGIAYGAFGAFEYGNGPNVGWLLALILGSAAGMSLTGFLALGLASFLRFVLAARQQPGWVLEHTEMALYLLAAIRVANWTSNSSLQVQARNIHVSSLYVSLGVSGFTTVTSVLILVAMGLALRRALPIIEESRTLV